MAQTGGDNAAVGERLCRAVNGPVNLARIVGNQHQIDASGQRLGRHPAEADVVDGAHVQIVGNQHAFVIPGAA
ncbi:hypothetical protein AT959_09765 [Dechloromonas denitrificans]|uniref:Uncharacterized protein n=1 Tax=Dechloromonas denitrificans TaxID=281362 RepID=A0A133XJ61_9RHOO|nr:hypothetical protein AT959_09765 [Dechloromonas denitrificans]